MHTWIALRRAALLLMIALLAFSLSACDTPAAENTEGGYLNEFNNTATSKIEATNDDVYSPDVETSAVGSLDTGDIALDENGMIDVSISVNGRVFAAKFYNNASARAIVAQMPFALDMNDFALQEKVQSLSFDLPSVSRETPATINAGDIYLWSGDSLVLFYTTFINSYSYVPVGYIVDTADLAATLGRGRVSVTFQIDE